MAKQLSLLPDPRRNTKLWWIRKQGVYGGSLNYRKVARPFDSRKLIHSVFKARVSREFWFSRREMKIRGLVDLVANRYKIRIRDLAVHRDHIHILFYAKKREQQARFLRLFSAEMARQHKRLNPQSTKALWLHRPFTRLVSWGRRSLQSLYSYFKQNRKEVLGFVAYKPRNHKLSEFLLNWKHQYQNST